MSNNTRLKHLLSPLGFGCILPRVPPPSRYVSRDPQKTSTPRTRNLISFSRLVTATAPRAGILRPTYLLFFQRERRETFNASHLPRNHPPITCFPPRRSFFPFASLYSPLHSSKRIYTSVAETRDKRRKKEIKYSGREEFRQKISQSFVRV